MTFVCCSAATVLWVHPSESHQVKSDETVKLSSDIHHTPTHITHRFTLPLFLACVLSVHVFKSSSRYFGSCLPTFIWPPFVPMRIHLSKVSVQTSRCCWGRYIWATPDSNHRSSVRTRPNKSSEDWLWIGPQSSVVLGAETVSSEGWKGGKQDGSTELTEWTKPGSLSCVTVLHLAYLPTISSSLSLRKGVMCSLLWLILSNQWMWCTSLCFWSLSGSRVVCLTVCTVATHWLWVIVHGGAAVKSIH